MKDGTPLNLGKRRSQIKKNVKTDPDNEGDQ
jgi:hypothetical protein